MKENTILKRINFSEKAGLYLLAAWVLLNLLQAAFTELFHDEAYYWMFSKDLAWGYAEHAPMVALVIRLGTLLFPGEFGVRFWVVVLNAGCLLLMYRLTDQKDLKLWAILLFSTLLVHIGGLLAVPDAPLVFFTAAFFYQYKFYLEADNVENTLLLTLIVSCLVYSKYHGTMILFFTILSNLSLLKRKSFWIIAISATLIFLPHLMWLWESQFATFKYHIFERIKESYRVSFTLDFFWNQFLIAGPFVSFVTIPAVVLMKPIDKLERAMKFSVLGIWIFLFLLSFRTHIEANWSASGFIPFLVLAYGFISRRENWKKWTYRLFWPSLLVIFLLRSYLLVNFLPFVTGVRNEVHGWDKWAQEVENFAGDLPVVFQNSYRYPAKYSFYTGKFAHGINNLFYHKTQYDIWPYEEQLQGREILLLAKNHLHYGDTLHTHTGGPFSYRKIDNFQSFNRINIEILQDELIFPPASEIEIPIRLINGYDKPKKLDENPEYGPKLNYFIFDHNRLVSMHVFEEGLPIDVLENHYDMRVKVDTPSESNHYKIIFSLYEGSLHLGIHGKMRDLEVVE